MIDYRKIIMKKIVFIATFVLLSCGGGMIDIDNQMSPPPQYVYIDRCNCLHLSTACISLLRENNALQIPSYAIRYHKKKNLIKNETQKDFRDYCSQCTRDEDFEEIEDIVRINGNKRVLYDRLSKDCNLGTFEQFMADIEDAEKRKVIYNAARDKGYADIGDNFIKFTNLFTHY